MVLWCIIWLPFYYDFGLMVECGWEILFLKVIHTIGTNVMTNLFKGGHPLFAPPWLHLICFMVLWCIIWLPFYYDFGLMVECGWEILFLKVIHTIGTNVMTNLFKGGHPLFAP
jgi:hypothetical protein